MRRLDLTGRRFGRLVAVVCEGSDSSGATWRCRCDCGQERVANASSLSNGRTTSCGCLKRERAKSLRIDNGAHGESPANCRTSEYGSWLSMRSRCNNRNSKKYKDYGERGITVDPRWDSFQNFLEDMGRKPGPGYSIDREDNSLGYSKKNCRWATGVEQANNKRSNRLLTYKGTTRTIAEWARSRGLRAVTIGARLWHGWSIDRALETP